MTASTSAPTAPQPGDRAPDLAISGPDGVPVRLSDLWSAAPRALALVFVRHFG